MVIIFHHPGSLSSIEDIFFLLYNILQLHIEIINIVRVTSHVTYHKGQSIERVGTSDKMFYCFFEAL
jgi:hypothetical protein